MKYGLSEQQLQQIIAFIKNYPEVEKAVLFGSRAIDTFKEGSDVDIALFGEAVTASLAMGIKFDIEEDTYLPFFFDFIAWPTITNEALKEHIDKVGVLIYRKGWREVKLGDVCINITDGSHYSPKDYKNGLPMFSVKDMMENGFDYSNPKTISTEDFEKLILSGCQPEKDDVLIAKDGSVMKHIFRVKNKPDYVLLSSIAILRPNINIVYPQFLVYAIKNPDIIDSILSKFVSGTGVPRIVLKDFKNVEIKIPPLPEQKAIASVLSSLDDKIDLLHRQNKTLESMAETLFRQWFVEEADEEWGETSLSEYAVFSNGKSRPTEYGNIPVYGGNGILSYTNISNYSGKSVIIGRVGAYCGSLYYEDGEIWVSDNALHVSAKNENEIHYLFYLLKSMNLNSMALGSSHPLLTQSLLKSIEVISPPPSKILEFNNIAKSFRSKIKKDQQQIRILEELRDTLLSKLMNGEVKI